MLESMALLKLKGFIHDLKGQIVESVPGMIRVYLAEAQEGSKDPPSGILSWLSGTPAPTPLAQRFTEALRERQVEPAAVAA